MIYELTTYDLNPRSVPQAERLIEKAYAHRKRYSEMTGCLRTEFGPLNQIVQIWQYDDMAHREAVVAAAEADPRCTHGLDGLLRGWRTEIMAPVSFSPELTPGRLGPYFELRTYRYPHGTLPTMMQAWEKAMPIRQALGAPVAAIWHTLVGTMDTLTHLWPYTSLEQREGIRRQVRATGKWPPYVLDQLEGGPGYEILSQENKVLLATAFSPLQ